MTDKEILILTPLYEVREHDRIYLRRDVIEQIKHGKVVTLPFGWKVVTKPSDVEIKVAEKPEEESTPWDFISQGKERLMFCTECGISMRCNPMYQYCPYCGKRHYFDPWPPMGDKKGEVNG